jgi:hypothetical protein
MPIINLDDIPNQEARPTLRNGQYTLRVIESKHVKYEKDGEQRERVDMTVEVTEPQVITTPEGPVTVAGIHWRESIYFTPKAMGMAKDTLSKFGVTGMIDPELLPNQLLGKSAKALVSVKATTFMDENTGAAVLDAKTGRPIVNAQYRVGKWLAKV